MANTGACPPPIPVYHEEEPGPAPHVPFPLRMYGRFYGRSQQASRLGKRFGRMLRRCCARAAANEGAEAASTVRSPPRPRSWHADFKGDMPDHRTKSMLDKQFWNVSGGALENSGAPVEERYLPVGRMMPEEWASDYIIEIASSADDSSPELSELLDRRIRSQSRSAETHVEHRQNRRLGHKTFKGTLSLFLSCSIKINIDDQGHPHWIPKGIVSLHRVPIILIFYFTTSFSPPYCCS